MGRGESSGRLTRSWGSHICFSGVDVRHVALAPGPAVLGQARHAYASADGHNVSPLESDKPGRATAVIGFCPVGNSLRVVLQFVYRSGTRTLEDWAGNLQEALTLGKCEKLVPQLTCATRLNMDVLQRVATPNQVCSLPRLEDVAVLQ